MPGAHFNDSRKTSAIKAASMGRQWGQTPLITLAHATFKLFHKLFQRQPHRRAELA
jgi:hypothetical protein